MTVLEAFKIDHGDGRVRRFSVTTTDGWQWIIMRSKRGIFMGHLRFDNTGGESVDVKVAHSPLNDDSDPGGDTPTAPWEEHDTATVADGETYATDDLDLLRGAWAIGFKNTTASSDSAGTVYTLGRSA